MKTTRQTSLESKISEICGAKVEITVRGLKEFTLSVEGNASAALGKAKEFLSLTGQISKWDQSFDIECDMTFAWFTVAA